MAALMKTPLGLGSAQLVRPTRSVKVAAVKQETEQASSSGKSEIYIGFPKNDYAPRAGRKGRVIKDDPAKYPGREDMGPLLGVVGGWAGGEAGLWKLREQYQSEAKTQAGTTSTKPLAPSSPIRQPQKNRWNVKTTSSAGKDAIYVGFSKDELELKKSGVQGRVIYDEDFKYPGKEDINGLIGVVGGFAGGEAALRQFVESGELKLRKPGDPTIKKQFSPLTLAFLIIIAVGGGGVLLTSAVDLGEGGVAEVLKAPVDETTKKLLLAAVGLVGAATAVGAARAAFNALQSRLVEGSETAQRVLITSGFLFAVFLAARAVLEN